MSSDFDPELIQILRRLVEIRPGASVTTLCHALNLDERLVCGALGKLDFAAPSSPIHVSQDVVGHAFAQSGDFNTLNFTISGADVGEQQQQLPTLDNLRSLMGNPEALHDALERHLVRNSRLAVLTQVLRVSSENLDWEARFQNWLRLKPDLESQKWFFTTVLEYYVTELTAEFAEGRGSVLKAMFNNLFSAGHVDRASDHFVALMGLLQKAVSWQPEHGLLLCQSALPFWEKTNHGTAQTYPSESVREMTQRRILSAMEDLSRHIYDMRNSNAANLFLLSLAPLLNRTRSQDVVDLLNMCLDETWLDEVLSIATSKELLSVLNLARPTRFLSDFMLTPQEKTLRHLRVDVTANRILDHIRGRTASSADFDELVACAGMVKIDPWSLGHPDRRQSG